MTKIRILLVIVAFSIPRFSPAETPVNVNALPPLIKRALDSATKGEPVTKITIHSMNGQTIYDVELEQKKAPNYCLRIGEDGQIFPETTGLEGTDRTPFYPEYSALAISAISPLKLEELPATARQTIRRRVGDGNIVKIAKQRQDRGPLAYRVDFNNKHEGELYVIVSENGQILETAGSDERRPDRRTGG